MTCVCHLCCWFIYCNQQQSVRCDKSGNSVRKEQDAYDAWCILLGVYSDASATLEPNDACLLCYYLYNLFMLSDGQGHSLVVVFQSYEKIGYGIVWELMHLFSAAGANYYNSAFTFQPGTQYCWADRGSMEREVCQTIFLYMATSRN